MKAEKKTIIIVLSLAISGFILYRGALLLIDFSVPRLLLMSDVSSNLFSENVESGLKSDVFDKQSIITGRIFFDIPDDKNESPQKADISEHYNRITDYSIKYPPVSDAFEPVVSDNSAFIAKITVILAGTSLVDGQQLYHLRLIQNEKTQLLTLAKDEIKNNYQLVHTPNDRLRLFNNRSDKVYEIKMY